MTISKLALAFSITLALGATACIGEGDDLADDIDTVEGALDAEARGDQRVRWQDERRPCRDCRPDGAFEFRGCVLLQRADDNRRVLSWLDDHGIDEDDCDRRDGLAHYRRR